MGLINLYKKSKLNNLISKAVENPELLRKSDYWVKIFTTALAVKEIRIMLEKLKGYKTYLVAAATAALTVAHMLGYITDETFKELMALLAAGGAATLAAKMNRVEKEVKKDSF